MISAVSKISDNLVKPSYQITITNSNGSEHHSVVSLKPEQIKKIEKITSDILNSIKKKGLTEKDLDAVIALLSSKSKR